MESTSVYPIAKGVIGAIWLISTASFFPPLQSAELGAFGRSLFGVLAVVHAVECVAFLGVLRKSARPLPGELWQTFLYGIVHISVVRNEIREREEGQG